MCRFTRRITGICAALLAAMTAPAPGRSAEPVPYPEHEPMLRVTVVDETGLPLDARVQVLDAAGAPLWPRGPGYHRYDAYSGHAFTYVTGDAVYGPREGRVRVIASHGPEWSTFDAWVPADRTEVTAVLRRLWDLRALGWYSGDTHVHVAHGGEGSRYTITPEDLGRIARAEDLGMTCALSNGLHFQGRGTVAASPEHLLHFAMEYRSALFGHLGVLGLETLLQPGCCLPGEPAFPLNRDIAAAAHAQEGFVIAAHPTTMDPALMGVDSGLWPYSGFNRELPVDILLGGLDALDVLSYSNLGEQFALEVWFDMLNLGYRPALTAGTDASVNRWFDPPAGGYRVYTKLPPGKEFGYEAWVEALGGGETFVTNGPLPIGVQLEGKHPGETVVLPGTGYTQLRGRMTAFTKEPLRYLDVYYNGQLRNRHILPFHYDALDFNFYVSVAPTDAWVVFKLSGPTTDPSRVGPEQFAVTSPIFIQGSPRAVDPALTDAYDGWIETLQALVEARPPGDPSDLQHVQSTLQSARATLAGTVESEPRAVGPPASAAASRGPGLRVSRGVFLATGTGTASVQVFDVRGRLRWAGDAVPLPAAVPVPHLLPHGVYYARLVAADGASLAVARLVKVD